jgi:cytochrome P450
MLEMIEARKVSAVLEESQDLMSNLIQASTTEKSATQKGFEFTHRDLLGNIFIFMFAGKLSRCRYRRSSIKLCLRA